MAQATVKFSVEPYGEFTARVMLTLEDQALCRTRVRRELLKEWSVLELDTILNNYNIMQGKDEDIKNKEAKDKLTDSDKSEVDSYLGLFDSLYSIRQMKTLIIKTPESFNWDEFSDAMKFKEIYVAWEEAARPFFRGAAVADGDNK